MIQIRTYCDPEECRQLWEKLWPDDCFFDLWPVRSLFNQTFGRPLHFQVFEENNHPKAMVSLCWIKEEKKFVHFPGETCNKTPWLEQNKIISCHPDLSFALIDSLPGSVHLRYLTYDSFFQTRGFVHQDDIGYLFLPKKYQYSFNQYLGEFSGRTRKKMTAEISGLEEQKVTIRHNKHSDVDLFFKMVTQTAEKKSHFSDKRFLLAFERLVAYMVKTGMMRITTILIGGKTAAVDIGALFKKTYTILASGTNPEFKGVANLINLHHISWACTQKLKLVDFLCNDTIWKKKFNLVPRPLYELKLTKPIIHDNPLSDTKGHKLCA
ncbi:MAG: GNAT family N-acetyltransferase [Proteobacteria bacterium]|nr:GNAT family N-acetyltransferase [Pseudomonadota bacterium]MBU1582183.1 GNAT family N-acetyltransferase [Pseudomonadota bacterium]MBU2631975.1 GNAT family N-acetyltransferase [Pseudomonadota bacterium]